MLKKENIRKIIVLLLLTAMLLPLCTTRVEAIGPKLSSVGTAVTVQFDDKMTYASPKWPLNAKLPEGDGAFEDLFPIIYLFEPGEDVQVTVNITTDKVGTNKELAFGSIAQKLTPKNATVNGVDVPLVKQEDLSYRIQLDPNKTNETVTFLLSNSFTNTITENDDNEDLVSIGLISDCMDQTTDDAGYGLIMMATSSAIAKDIPPAYKIVDHKDPTCTDLGYNKYSDGNNDVVYISVSPLGHDWNEWEYVEKEDGSTVHQRTCKNCGEIESQTHEHKFTETVVNPTCTEMGSVTKTCECGKTEIAYQPAKGHQWAETWTKMEDKPGYETNKCANCDAVRVRKIASEDTELHVHKYVDTVVAPTCVSQGYTKHTCSCGHEYVDTYVAANGHDWGEWVPDDAINPKEGAKTEGRTCKTCNTTETRKIEEHVMEDHVAEPTCTAQGLTVHQCKTCDYATVDTFVAAHGHKWGEWKVDVEATSTTDGKEVRTCEVCQAVETRIIPKHPHKHNYVDTVVDPTCTEQGYTEHKCDCGDSYKDNYTVPAGHKWGDWIVVKDSTESEFGEEKRTCSVCKKEETRQIEKKPHTHEFVDTVVDPTCTEKGYTLHKCSKCGEEKKDNYVDALGHDWGEWVVTKEATETEKGSKERTCNRCQKKEVVEIDALKHQHEYTKEVVKPTCTKEGYTIYTCECGHSYKDDFVKANGHDWGEWETVKKPTDDKEGLKERKCKVCGETETEKIPKLTDPENNKDPKLGFEGSSEKLVWSAIFGLSVISIAGLAYITFKKKEN